MQMLRVLVAEEDEEFCKALAEQMQGLYQVRSCREGNEALAMLRTFKPDVLVLDLMLPGLDGISLLQDAVASGLHPAVLATTRFASNYILETLTRLGVGYLMMKPCDVKATVCRVADLSQRMGSPLFSHPDPRTTASNLLLSLGVPTKLRGYGYLREAVLLMAGNPDQSITKELYPAVGRLCGATPVQVERSMRSAIHAAWCQGDRQLWKLYFGPAQAGFPQKPTNAAFISRMADALRTDKNLSFERQVQLLAES